MKMSSPNCSVKVSSHGDMGDRHDESQGGPSAGLGAVGRGREDHDRGDELHPGDPAAEQALVSSELDPTKLVPLE
jgi:hypothetical protein